MTLFRYNKDDSQSDEEGYERKPSATSDDEEGTYLYNKWHERCFQTMFRISFSF